MADTNGSMAAPANWHRPCPVCGADRPQPLFDNRMARLDGLDMSYRVGHCPDCGFCYAFDLPHPATYDEYYRSLSKYDVVISDTAIPPVAAARIQKTLELCVPKLPANALIADVGCGFGALLSGFKSAGFSRLYGIDPAPGAGREAARLFGLSDVRTGSLRDANNCLPLAQADLLCLTGVAEHLPCLSEDLRHLFAQLPEHAKVLIEVPAQERFLAPPVEPFGEFSLEHIQFFSAETLSRLMAGFGFTSCSISISKLEGCTDSLFGLFSRATAGHSAPTPSAARLDDYIAYSSAVRETALHKIASSSAPFIIFGAGSHTARLLPQLETLGMTSRIVAIVDNNQNLQGKKLGGFIVHASDFLAENPGISVLVSSFNAQEAIARQLAGRHPTILLYDAIR
jgi:SAM-dependent methyltransferase